MNNFLSFLKRNRSLGIPSRETSSSAFFFRIATDQAGCYVETVDQRQSPLFLDYRSYTGELAQTLRLFEHLRDACLLQVNWERESAGEKIYLADSPYLMWQLARCHNLVNEAMLPIRLVEQPTSLCLELHKERGMLVPKLRIEDEERQPELPVRLLTDSFALRGDQLFRILPIGDHYQQMDAFLAPFEESLVEEYLSVFYSYIQHVRVEYADYAVSFSDEAIEMVPTLVFEKVDRDRALHLRLACSIPGYDVDFVTDFDVNWVASLLPDRQIVLKRIVQASVDELAQTMWTQLMRYAPDRLAQKELYRDGDFFIVPEETAAPFLQEELPSLLLGYRLVGVERLRNYRVKPVEPKLYISLRSGIHFLEGELKLNLDGESFMLADLLKQYRKHRYITLSDDTRAVLGEGYIERLGRVFQPLQGGEVRISFFDLPEMAALNPQQVECQEYERMLNVFKGFNDLKDTPLQEVKVKAVLRPYQAEGVKWLRYLHDNKLGGCLADEMGLGKTLQTITLLASLYPEMEAPSLIVMPYSLLYNWRIELTRFAPQLSVYCYHGGMRNLEEALQHSVILTTYTVVRNDIELLQQRQFHYVILEESQHIKAFEAQVTQAIRQLNAPHRLALSGTPFENNLKELYSLFCFLNPGMFGSLEEFNTRYATPIHRKNDKEAMESLRRKIYPFLLRRLKKDVLQELPDVMDNQLFVEMNEEQARLYEQRRAYYYQQVNRKIDSDGLEHSRATMLQAINELRRIASIPECMSGGQITSPKLEVVINLVAEAVANGHKVVIFFNYLLGVELVSDLLDKLGIDFAQMTGSTRNRKSVVERFQNDPQCRVFLMTLKTGGVGLNLTAADTVFIFEPWWNKAAEDQAVSRLHRMGQLSKVLSYSILVQGTIEEKICWLQQQKKELFAGLICSDSHSLKHLSKEDINYILG